MAVGLGSRAFKVLSYGWPTPLAFKEVGMKPEIMWAIVGRYGLYTGTALTRKDMISRHCWAYYHGYPAMPPEDEVKRIWAKRRKGGDRAVKVEMNILD